MLHCIYTLAFTCLLRFDEVLQIQYHHIKVVDKEAGKIELNLLFRKTNQYGGEYIDRLHRQIQIDSSITNRILRY